MNRWIPALLLTPLLAGPALAGKVTVPKDGQLDRAYQARRVALLVGVDTYADPDLEPLAFAGKDARDMARALRDEAVGDFDEVHVLTGPDATSRQAILERLEAVTADLQRDDTFVLYLSGHGTLTLDPLEGTRLWFLPADAELATPAEEGLAVADLEATLSSLTPRRRVLIMDTCHNGRSDSSRAALNDTTRDRLASLRGEPPAPNPVAQVTESEARLYAAQFYQPAMEDRALGNGVYTHFLLRALTEDRGTADLDRDGLVDVTEAHDYAQERTIRHTGGLQVPRAEYQIVGRESIFLSGDPTRRTRAENALVSAYNGLLASARLLVDGQSRGTLPGVVAIEPGIHRIRLETADGRTIHSERVRLRAGEHLQIEELVRPTDPELTVHLGAVATHGAQALNPFAPDLEVGWRPVVRRTFTAGVHLRVSGLRGAAPDFDASFQRDGAHEAQVNLLPTVGVHAAWRPHPALSVGPTLEAGARWRQIQCVTCAVPETYSDVGALVAPGLRAGWRTRINDATDALVRYDVRLAPVPGAGDTLELGVLHGLSVGAAFR
jgi:uncharacterized caspase-like protein